MPKAGGWLMLPGAVGLLIERSKAKEHLRDYNIVRITIRVSISGLWPLPGNFLEGHRLRDCRRKQWHDDGER